MKKTLTLVLTFLIITSTSVLAFTSGTIIRTLPIIIETISYPLEGAFTLLLVAKAAVLIAASASEPLENHEVGIQYDTGTWNSTISWVDGEYPTRSFLKERTYSYQPQQRIANWWIKDTFTVWNKDGSVSQTITISQQPPGEIQFCNQEVKYRRYGMSGQHQTSFQYDTYETVTAYAMRKGSAAWGRPILAQFGGWRWNPLFRDDICYHSYTMPYNDNRYLLICPWTWTIWKPARVINTEFNQLGSATTFFSQ